MFIFCNFLNSNLNTRYAHENGCEWNEDTCDDGAYYDHLECLKYDLRSFLPLVPLRPFLSHLPPIFSLAPPYIHSPLDIYMRMGVLGTIEHLQTLPWQAVWIVSGRFLSFLCFLSRLSLLPFPSPPSSLLSPSRTYSILSLYSY